MENTGRGSAGRLHATGCHSPLTSGSEIQCRFHCHSLMHLCTLNAPLFRAAVLRDYQQIIFIIFKQMIPDNR